MTDHVDVQQGYRLQYRPLPQCWPASAETQPAETEQHLRQQLAHWIVSQNLSQRSCNPDHSLRNHPVAAENNNYKRQPADLEQAICTISKTETVVAQADLIAARRIWM